MVSKNELTYKSPWLKTSISSILNRYISTSNWKDISIAHVIIIIKSEVSTFPIVIIFLPGLCAWDVCYIIFCHFLHMRSGRTGNLFPLLLCSLWWVQTFGYVLACRSYSFVCTVHHLIIIIVQTYLKALNKMSVRYILSSVWVRLSIFSPSSIIQYVGLCVISLPISLVMDERIYIYFVFLSSSNRKYELVPIV